MKRARNRYNNQIKFTTLFCLLVIGFMICGVGSAFVYVKNQHVESGNQKRLLETEISALKSEIAQIDRQIAAKLVHPAVERTLDDNGTALVQIPPGSVLRIDGGQEEILARNE